MSNISKTATDTTMGSMEVEYETTPGLSIGTTTFDLGWPWTVLDPGHRTCIEWSSNLTLIERAYVTFYQWLIVRWAVSRTVRNFDDLLVKKSPLRHTPVVFNALATGDSFRTWWTLCCKKLKSMSYLSVKILSSYVHSFWHNTNVWRTDGHTELL